MPRRYKRKRRRRKSFKRRVGAIAKRSVLKSLTNVKRFIVEDRGHYFAPQQDQIMYGAIQACIGTNSELEAVADHALDVSANPTQSVRIYQHHQKIYFRNLSPHPVFLRVWTVTPKKHIILTAADNTLAEHAINRLIGGWMQNMDDTDDTDMLSGKTAVTTNAENIYNIHSNSSYLYPSHSEEFRKWWKCFNPVTLKMNPGDDLYYTVKVPAFTYNYSTWHGLSTADQSTTGPADLSQVYEGIKGITRMVMFRCHGAMGHGNADQTKTGYMAADVGWSQTCSARVYKMNNAARDTEMTLNKDDMTAVTLEGPTEHTFVDED